MVARRRALTGWIVSTAKKRIPRNMARIEFLACREEIEKLLAQGFDKRKVHTRLTESGQITMSYDALCKVLIKASQNMLKIQSIAAPPTPADPVVPLAAKPPTTRPSQPNVIKARSDELQDPRTIDPKSVF